MNYKQKLGYVALGGVLMLIGVIVSSVVTPILMTQKEVFGEITCTGLRVVNQDGEEVIRLRISESGSGFVEVLNNAETPAVYLMGDSDGGGVRVFNKSGVSVVRLEGYKIPSSPYHDFGGVVMITDDAGKDALLLSPNKYGGRIFVYGKHTHYLAELAADQFGGYLTVWNHEDFGLNRVLLIGSNSDGDGFLWTNPK